MTNSKLTQSLVGLLGALVGVFVCALAGIDFSAQDVETQTSQQNVLIGQSPTTMNYQASEVSQLRAQIQQQRTQLSLCQSDVSFLRMDALRNQANQQRR